MVTPRCTGGISAPLKVVVPRLRCVKRCSPSTGREATFPARMRGSIRTRTPQARGEPLARGVYHAEGVFAVPGAASPWWQVACGAAATRILLRQPDAESVYR